eukprot:scaffold624_cov402-Prasinococcus_capsulatus_cf.AAC.79
MLSRQEEQQKQRNLYRLGLLQEKIEIGLGAAPLEEQLASGGSASVAGDADDDLISESHARELLQEWELDERRKLDEEGDPLQKQLSFSLQDEIDLDAVRVHGLDRMGHSVRNGAVPRPWPSV